MLFPAKGVQLPGVTVCRGQLPGTRKHHRDPHMSDVAKTKLMKPSSSLSRRHAVETLMLGRAGGVPIGSKVMVDLPLTLEPCLQRSLCSRQASSGSVWEGTESVSEPGPPQPAGPPTPARLSNYGSKLQPPGMKRGWPCANKTLFMAPRSRFHTISHVTNTLGGTVNCVQTWKPFSAQGLLKTE